MPRHREEGGTKTEGRPAIWWLYVCRCSDGSLYTGIALDPAKRLQQHNAGIGAKYTKGRGPITLHYVEKAGTLSQALKRELEIKGMHRWEKETLGCF